MNQTSVAALTVTRTDAGGLALLVVDTGAVRAVFVPSVGGRLLSLTAGGAEFLWRNERYLDAGIAPRVPLAGWPQAGAGMGSWLNLGGAKIWPAPQGQGGPGEWDGPPDPVLDGGPWSCTVSGDDRAVTVVLTSADDSRSGLRMSRAFRFTAGSAQFEETVSFTAALGRAVRWAIWEVVQIDTAAAVGSTDPRVGIFVRDTGAIPPLSLLPASRGRATVAVTERPGGRAYRIPVTEVVDKLGFPSATGELSYRRPDGGELILSFDVDGNAEYPDGGSRAEIWMQHPLPEPIAELGGLHPDSHLVELEALGPLRALPPGESSTLTVRWTVVPPRH
ncbi:hypothetical protein [Compostimonas suwonensis]|uniref:Galactose mutarotase-like enzyme n=1 Tax=Compostimonas suwonensis TaxID=1048394 RepID=A0A2M9BWG4_9MICO|nr:hypothetical protein [Compostimonas suwonensis]PJJ62297.1 hypothetical protein CLV54_2094 [Compostimonas suwonensis]